MPFSRCFLLTGILWFCFLTKLIFYSSFVPLWEGYDEFEHFAFVQHLVATHELPDLKNADVSREVAESLCLAPVPWTIRQWTPGWTTHDDFWRLPAAARQQRERDLKALPPAMAREVEPNLRLYEAQQPPLAYLFYAIPYAVFQSTNLPTRAWILRIAGSAIASLVIPLGFILARRVSGNASQAVGVVAVIASMPELAMTADHGGNEPLAIVLGAACIYGLCRLGSRRSALFLGCMLGCGLLTKAYFLTLVPVIAWRNRRTSLQLIVTFAVAIAIVGWWYGRALHDTGTLTGTQIAIAASQSTRAFSGINWLRVADFALVSHIWLGGWSFLVLRTWMYRVMEMILLVAYIRLPAAPLPPLRLCLAALLSFWAGMGYFAFTTYLATGQAAVLGFYAYALVVPEVVCLIAGLSALVPKAATRFIVPALVICFAAIEVYGTVFCLMPYYAGITAHTAKGSVPAMQAGVLFNGKIAELFRNLAVNKPDFLSPGVLLALWAAFLLAVAGIVAVSVSRFPYEESV